MRHVRLVAHEDAPTGNLGFIIKGCDGPEIFSDTTGQLTAHDLLEHQNGPAAIGCPADELEAIGAIWQVRGRHGDLLGEDQFANYHAPAYAIAGDVLNVAMDIDSLKWWPGGHGYRTKRHDYDEDFMAILEHAEPMIRLEMDSEFPLQDFLDDALHLMRMGFNKAKRRFGMGFEGSNTFIHVRDAVKQQAKWLEFPGQEFRLSYCSDAAHMTEIFPDFD